MVPSGESQRTILAMVLNRRILHDPRVRHVLDVALRMPGGTKDLDAAVEALMGLIRQMVDRAVDAGMGLKGYDYEAMEVIGDAMGRLMDRRCVNLTPGDEEYERILRGALIGFGIGCGGTAAYGRYIRRYGAIPKYVEMGMTDMAMSLRHHRSALDASLAEGRPSTMTRAIRQGDAIHDQDHANPTRDLTGTSMETRKAIVQAYDAVRAERVVATKAFREAERQALRRDVVLARWAKVKNELN